MFTYYQAENSTAEPALVNAIEQGLRAEHGVVTEDDILMELTKWVEASDNDILSDIYQQTINYVVSGQWSVVSTLRFKVLCLIGNLI
ncbi:biofilm-dependent modulation protein [Escherichia coli]|uniref:biofilm-dependent modulation protein n=1 Tax=Escherichia coli TaxID=562 RepID=UPI00069A5B2B|nr:biofilm-dependent modulation protein [Escherichia coli]EFH3410227.1 biofilm-dependent modulation protein [Escherichia coli]EFH3509235.1 biofilm-dependent modulation protein [Escherichia coli]EGM8543962.1 biofilm-dependent modulation protein [Escherichia coli]MBB0648944.1 biofilm-dependent modulation protein [Escherichia coli]MBS8675234.1 biofilm-dependent modulation protein [Escherichia coli]